MLTMCMEGNFLFLFFLTRCFLLLQCGKKYIPFYIINVGLQTLYMILLDYKQSTRSCEEKNMSMEKLNLTNVWNTLIYKLTKIPLIVCKIWSTSWVIDHCICIQLRKYLLHKVHENIPFTSCLLLWESKTWASTYSACYFPPGIIQ